MEDPESNDQLAWTRSIHAWSRERHSVSETIAVRTP